MLTKEFTKCQHTSIVFFFRARKHPAKNTHTGSSVVSATGYFH